ncbi:cholinesterase 1 [Strongylocentrotus purpuratus]|uniref:Carboxylic ester hydrolase n=1 Tax=Strongylocentrotus purpuratus TaxID=7668 RepID=A0A7M7STL5_STRPU|nr:cholinesterase 1 [Strongylocentrotus purpuratus]
MARSTEQSCCFHVVVIVAMMSVAYATNAVKDDERLVVKTSTATFHGKRIEVNPYLLPDFHGSAAAYTRIPYTEPPLGELRFRRPVPKVIEGDFDATRTSVACPQALQPLFKIDMDMSEDCLTLDVFVPEPKPLSAAVMVWIHGGGYVVGAGSIPEALPVPLAVMNDVIVVTINYRLNILGFIVLGEEDVSEANVGMLDQRQALVWVQENIAAFGGDPSRVTIFGESAGGMSVSLHVLSPMSKGLFSGAILQSGAVTSQWSYGTLAEGEETAFVYGRALNCSQNTHRELAECLRGIPADDIVSYLASNPPEAYTHAIRPFVDGEFIPRDPKEMYAAGEVNEVSIMIGCLSEEGTMIIIPPDASLESSDRPVLDKTNYDGLLPVFIRNVDELVKDTAALVYMSPEEMMKAEPEYTDVIVDCMGDFFFLCPSFEAADHLSAAGLPTYKYIMSHRPSVSIWGKGMTWLGATHGEDIAYTFGAPFLLDILDPDQSYLLTGLFNEEEVELAVQVMRYWSNFAKTGNPNIQSKDGEPESRYPLWEAYSKDNKTYKDLSVTLENRVGYPNPQSCMFQKDLLPKLQANAAEMARLKSLLEEKVMADTEKTCVDPESCPEQ